MTEKTRYSKDLWKEYPFQWPEFFAWKDAAQTNDNTEARPEHGKATA